MNADQILNKLHSRATANGVEENEFKKSSEYILNDIEYKLAGGWSPEDVFKYFSYCEEINPNLSEETALKMMGEIANKYGIKRK